VLLKFLFVVFLLLRRYVVGYSTERVKKSTRLPVMLLNKGNNTRNAMIT